ncbi:hypothetical protein K474DRAFT_1679987 [Panus rudis PR-1116 ss-1]|nr:hypothetical protein K474DRAFT_1679987 [Panus rudis PR-1116 ss-1]
MYPYLIKILDKVREFYQANGKRIVRRFFSRDGTKFRTVVLGQEYGAPSRFPDLLLVDEHLFHSPNMKDVECSLSDCLSLVEVKKKKAESPYYKRMRHEDDVKGILSQAGDYARLHLAARPFQLFGTYLLIYGDMFCIARFDRYGISLSREEPMYTWSSDSNKPVVCKLQQKFIDVAAQFMTIVDEKVFGADPGVIPIRSPEQTVKFSVPVGLSTWTTLEGEPFWASMSLLGRGTAVWKVTSDPQTPGTVRILKNAWRLEGRMSEKDIYDKICAVLEDRRGLMEVIAGGDVFNAEADSQFTRLDVAYLRQGLTSDTDGAPLASISAGYNPVLHRVVYGAIGKPLWEFNTEVEFMKGLRAIVSVLARFHDLGIMHRDISPGNLYLSIQQDPGDGMEGLISDYEFAHAPNMTERCTDVTVEVPVASGDRKHGSSIPNVFRETLKASWGPVPIPDERDAGPPIAGTANFFALELLEWLLADPPKPKPKPQPAQVGEKKDEKPGPSRNISKPTPRLGHLDLAGDILILGNVILVFLQFL